MFRQNVLLGQLKHACLNHTNQNTICRILRPSFEQCPGWHSFAAFGENGKDIFVRQHYPQNRDAPMTHHHCRAYAKYLPAPRLKAVTSVMWLASLLCHDIGNLHLINKRPRPKQVWTRPCACAASATAHADAILGDITMMKNTLRPKASTAPQYLLRHLLWPPDKSQIGTLLQIP